MRVLMLTQALDEKDPLLGFVTSWVRLLAQRVNGLDVICFRSKAERLPSNVRVSEITRWLESGRTHRLLELHRHASGLMRSADVVLAHMIPRFVLASAPAATLHRRPIVLWYVHRAESLELRVAAGLSRFVATAVPESFPFHTSNLRVLGHGVDGDEFSPGAMPASPPFILCVGRLMPIKHQATLLRAFRTLTGRHNDVRVLLVGGVPDGKSDAYQRSLADLASELGITDRVTFAGPVIHDAVRNACRRATVAVNLSPTGLFDKAALESMMTGVPTIVASRSFDALTGSNTWLRLDSPDDHDALARALDRALSLTPTERADLTTGIRARTVAAHGLDGFMDRLVDLLREAADGRA